MEVEQSSIAMNSIQKTSKKIP